MNGAHQLARYARVFLSRTAGTALQFLAQLIIGHWLGARGLGALGLAQSWTSLIGAVGNLGTAQLVLRRSAQGRNGRSPAARSTWLSFGITVAAIGGALTAAAIAALFAAGALRADASWMMLTLTFLGGASYAVARVPLEDMKGQARVEYSMLLEYAAPFGLVLAGAPLVLCAGTRWSPEIIAGSYACCYVALAFWLGRRILRAHKITLRNLARRLRRSASEMAALWGVQVGNQLTAAGPVLWLSGSASLAELGGFAVGMRLVGLTATLSGTVSAYFAQSVIRAYRENNVRQVRQLYASALVVNGALSTLVLSPMLLVPRLTLSLFGQTVATSEAVTALMLLASLRLARQWLGLSELFLASSGRSGLDVGSQAVSIVLMVGVMLWSPGPAMLTAALAAGVASLARALISFSAVLLVLQPYRRSRD